MKGEMRAMDGTGDSKIMWNSDNEAEVDVARNAFNELKKKGYTAFSVKKNGDKDEQISKFDAEAEKLIMVPRMAGG